MVLQIKDHKVVFINQKNLIELCPKVKPLSSSLLLKNAAVSLV